MEFINKGLYSWIFRKVGGRSLGKIDEIFCFWGYVVLWIEWLETLSVYL